MNLNELLFKYDSNQTFKVFLEHAIESPGLYANVIESDDKFEIIPTNLFMTAMVCQGAKLVLDKKLNVIEEDCDCLLFYNTKECIHVVALYALALLLLDRDKFDNEYNIYVEKKNETVHSSILNDLANTIKVNNPYFGLIHLTPIIEVINGNYVLSVKIGFDKDYIIKSISEFVNATEENKFVSYGQRLEFVHSYETFDNISKEFYSFLRNISNENTQKCITIKKSHILKILEFYVDNKIDFRLADELKPLERNITIINNCNILLDENELKLDLPIDSKILVSGINRCYFISKDTIYGYTYKSMIENKVFNNLFKVNGSLKIKSNSAMFISNLLPIIRNNIIIDDSFYKAYPIPVIKINSYMSYENESIVLQPKISCSKEDRNSPYLRELHESYIETINSYYFIKDTPKKYVINDLESQYKFLTSDLTQIKAYGDIYFDEAMKSLKAIKSKRTGVNVSYNVGLLSFSFENEDMTQEDIKKMLDAYHEKKKFIRLENSSILEIDEKAAKEIDDFLEDFNISSSELIKPVEKPLNYLLKLVAGIDTNISLDGEVVKMITTIQNYKKSKYELDDYYKPLLRPYQVDGFKWLKTLSSYGFGGILADDMGLGKTLEVISFLSSDKEKMPSLIVCPMSLVYNWENECDKWKLECPTKLILGSISDRENTIRNIDPCKKMLYITSYDSLRRDINLYNTKFRFVIADEAQYIKNQYAQKSEAIKSLSSDINFALTGTPIENGLADLWSIFDFLLPGYLSNYSHFKSRYESLIIHDDYEALDNLKKRVNPFILRRTKKDVLNDLPDKIEDYYYYKMEPKQKEIYDGYVMKLKDDIKEGGKNILALLTRLRQICITPELILQEHFENTKINMASDIIKSSIEAGHRILVFSQFAQSFPILSRELDDMGIQHFILDGTTKAKTRIEMVNEFNSNTDIKVFIISLKAGGTGLNLVGADMVIHLDPWWNSSAELQASDRAYRIGQTKNVYVLRLICKNTIEEKVIELQKIKLDLAESIVDTNNNFKLSKQDILELLE